MDIYTFPYFHEEGQFSLYKVPTLENRNDELEWKDFEERDSFK